MFKIPQSKELLKSFVNNLPKKPGTYQFLDKEKTPIYIEFSRINGLIYNSYYIKHLIYSGIYPCRKTKFKSDTNHLKFLIKLKKKK